MLANRLQLLRLKSFGEQAHCLSQLAFTKYGKTDKKKAPLVICHGLFGQKSNWNSIAKAVQARLNNAVYCVDLRNHGDNNHYPTMTYAEMAEDVDNFIETVVFQDSDGVKCDILGHSMGGKVVMAGALDENYSKKFRKVIVEDATPVAHHQGGEFVGYVAALKKVNYMGTRKEIDNELKVAVPDNAVRGFLLTNLARDEKTGGWKFKANLDVINDYVTDTLPNNSFVGKGICREPALFIIGEKSNFVPAKDRGHILKLFPNVEFTTIPKASHWVHADQPKAFMDVVVNYLK
uniref:AB hydrolase-1 domain-containing protein n=1 Tax=Rhabditophanes sp. KR3021 TaxID=114890 RepID=A0AC35UCX1_9BILA